MNPVKSFLISGEITTLHPLIIGLILWALAWSEYDTIFIYFSRPYRWTFYKIILCLSSLNCPFI